MDKKKYKYIVKKILIYFLEAYISIKIIPYVGILGFVIIAFQIYINVIRIFERKTNKEKSEKIINFDVQKKTRTKAEHGMKKRRMSEYEIERFAIMCNAWMEHQDEMEQYKENCKAKSEKEE